ncbi:phospho-N-acetylmuramoyl-pentapeptide-transferase [Aequitasia blattaphilus]|uniref:Phospho-N-acetylmuramoyl-pentapeptide-transferase n=1 Tax=Aequitasia blattaphilus TaxID=2949332 RepID=A0ABT1E674_9FIRM|nr:phospho-N-acetylmuramoyl-pentapeptide-transferase [Aequitasia blattaphilus]MCP1101337.1 phospho-N-acetylmuramoyl-pentapeptide-transferase [Aequitasia blattaphilus]MCR8613977.1 phospho-N-acetylmuramoyl-pentapeptide-transferase [Aequitasia blattaphilus]
MDNKVLLAGIAAFIICAIQGPFVIPFLQRMKMGQTEREEGVASHLKKAGTPTMGGVMILSSVVLVSLFFVRDYPHIVPVLISTVGFGLIGFIDDYLKVIKKDSDGLLPKQKLVLQFLVTIIFAFYVNFLTDVSFEILIPFLKGRYFNIGWFFVPLLFVVVLGTVNGTNFTDGLDGLASSVTIPVAIFLSVASVVLNGGIEPIALIMVGALMGFLLFNSYPAKVFMGDTGSLALGGFVAGAAYMLNMPFFILIFGLVYLIEVVSVMIQVTYFKKTGGKRFFKMAPIHHHFELLGWSETRVVTVFTIVTTILCGIAYMAM